MLDPAKKYYTVAEAAVVLEANRTTIHKWIDKGRLQRAWHLPGQVQITGASVRKFPGKQKPGRPKKQPVVKEPRGVARRGTKIAKA
jgi:excisionase family DNA binding protein